MYIIKSNGDNMFNEQYDFKIGERYFTIKGQYRDIILNLIMQIQSNSFTNMTEQMFSIIKNAITDKEINSFNLNEYKYIVLDISHIIKENTINKGKNCMDMYKDFEIILNEMYDAKYISIIDKEQIIILTTQN